MSVKTTYGVMVCLIIILREGLAIIHMVLIDLERDLMGGF